MIWLYAYAVCGSVIGIAFWMFPPISMNLIMGCFSAWLLSNIEAERKADFQKPAVKVPDSGYSYSILAWLAFLFVEGTVFSKLYHLQITGIVMAGISVLLVVATTDITLRLISGVSRASQAVSE